MKKSRILLGLITISLCGCSLRKPLVIPNVDVENLKVNLPDLPTYNEGEIRADNEFEYIDMYEVSDFHGAVDYEEHQDGARAYLGLERLGTYLDEKRTQNLGGTILLSSGDMFQGSADSNLTRGYMVNYCMHYMGFDAMAVGNHEFDNGIESLAKYYGSMKAEKIGTNYDFSDTKLNGMFKPYLIRNYGEKRVAVIGINIEPKGIISENNVAGLRCLPAIEVADATAKYLKQVQKVDYVIMLSHIGYDYSIPAFFCL